MPLFFLQDLFRGKKGAFFLCFLCSLLMGKLFFSEQMKTVGDWICSCMEEMDVHTLEQKGFFCYLLLHRGILLFLLVLFGLTKIKKILLTLSYLVCGLLAGGVCASFLSAYGWKGFFVFFFSFFPHGIVYVVLFVYLFWLFCERQEEEKNTQAKRLKQGPQVIVYGFAILVLFSVGLYLEGTVNPLLLDWIRQFL